MTRIVIFRPGDAHGVMSISVPKLEYINILRVQRGSGSHNEIKRMPDESTGLSVIEFFSGIG